MQQFLPSKPSSVEDTIYFVAYLPEGELGVTGPNWLWAMTLNRYPVFEIDATVVTFLKSSSIIIILVPDSELGVPWARIGSGRSP